MLYLNTEDILSRALNWRELIGVIERATMYIHRGEYVQPMKPYLRYGDPKNRIIAMPGFVGGEINTAGIKWIASFPDNIMNGLPRAHSLTVLNNAETGVPVCIINTAVISAIRTAAVSGLMVSLMSVVKGPRKISIGVAGMGVIGSMHIHMLGDVLGDRIETIRIYDKRSVDISSLKSSCNDKIQLVSSWKDAYQDADLFITATVSPERYIDMAPKNSSWHLNVSLRDYCPAIRKYIDVMVVDNWDEVCRENTDVEVMFKENLLVRRDAISLDRLIGDEQFRMIKEADTLMFNPMGMSAYDIAIAHYYYRSAMEKGIGVQLK